MVVFIRKFSLVKILFNTWLFTHWITFNEIFWQITGEFILLNLFAQLVAIPCSTTQVGSDNFVWVESESSFSLLFSFSLSLYVPLFLHSHSEFYLSKELFFSFIPLTYNIVKVFLSFVIEQSKIWPTFSCSKVKPIEKRNYSLLSIIRLNRSNQNHQNSSSISWMTFHRTRTI